MPSVHPRSVTPVLERLTYSEACRVKTLGAFGQFMRIGIVGGGIYGTAIAYFLAHFGANDVVLFEKNQLGGESTSRSAGIVRQHYSHRGHIELAARGREILASFDEIVGGDAGFHRNGYLALTGSENVDEFRDTVRIQQEIGLDTSLVDPSDLDGHVPGIDPEGVAVGALERDAGFADPYLAATGFATAAQELGVELRQNTEVLDVACENGEISSVSTSTGREKVDYLVNAAGPWGADVGRLADVDLPLKWYESKIVVLQADDPYGVCTPTVSDAGLQAYAKPEPGGTFIVGGIRRPPVDRSRGLEGVDIEYLDLVRNALESRLPGYADAEVVETWSGIITATPDWYQIVGVPDGYENLYNMVGGSGHRFKEAPAFAEDVARDILGEEPVHELEPYRLERFDEDDLLSDLEKARKDE
jgi:sarcosine oxidase subunit beta